MDKNANPEYAIYSRWEAFMYIVATIFAYWVSRCVLEILIKILAQAVLDIGCGEYWEGKNTLQAALTRIASNAVVDVRHVF